MFIENFIKLDEKKAIFLRCFGRLFFVHKFDVYVPNRYNKILKVAVVQIQWYFFITKIHSVITLLVVLPFYFFFLHLFLFHYISTLKNTYRAIFTSHCHYCCFWFGKYMLNITLCGITRNNINVNFEGEIVFAWWV